ncbi:MAG: hypothetical protein Q4F03_04895 [Eubacteriales bacterium]|nr:hypothetical protein [Eubacteriales bacterium]
MIISASELMKKYPDFTGQDESILQEKLDGIENLIRKYTNNNFQNRNIRFTGDSLGNRIFGGHPFIRVGDTLQISESEVNDGLYVVKEVTENFVRLDKDLFEVPHNLLTKVVYPVDIKQGVINLVKYECEMRDKVGVKFERLSRHDVEYYDMTSANQVMGYPVSLLGFLKPYMKARF